MDLVGVTVEAIVRVASDIEVESVMGGVGCEGDIELVLDSVAGSSFVSVAASVGPVPVAVSEAERTIVLLIDSVFLEGDGVMEREFVTVVVGSLVAVGMTFGLTDEVLVCERVAPVSSKDLEFDIAGLELDDVSVKLVVGFDDIVVDISIVLETLSSLVAES